MIPCRHHKSIVLHVDHLLMVSYKVDSLGGLGICGACINSSIVDERAPI